MKNKKGFTLVELLAVIAILAILVIIALPNVMSMFNKAKKSSFETEVKQIYRISKSQWMIDSLTSTGRKTYMKVDGVDYGVSKLPLDTRNNLNYQVVFDGTGKVIRLIVTDGTYQYDSGEVTDLNENDIGTDKKIETVAETTPDKKITIDKNDKDYKTQKEKEDAMPQLKLSGYYTKTNGMYRYKTINIFAYEYHEYGVRISTRAYWHQKLIDIPTGATQVLIQYADGNNTYTFNDSKWLPSSIVSGKYRCANRYYNCTTASCTGGFLDFNKVNTTFMSYRGDGINLANRMVVVADGHSETNGDLLAIKKNGNSLEFDDYYLATGYNHTGIRFKFRGAGYKDSDWYLVQFADSLRVEQGCYSGESEVIVYDKKKKKKLKKKLKDLTYDDLVLVWDFDKGEYTFAKPLWIRKLEIAQEYYEVKFSDGNELDIVHDHRIFSTELNSFESILKLKPGMHTINCDGEEVEILSIKKIKAPTLFTSVITDYHMNLYVNGILTGIKLSNLYEIKNMKFVKNEVVNNEKNDFCDMKDEMFNGLRLSEANFGDYYTTPQINEFVEGIEKYRK